MSDKKYSYAPETAEEEYAFLAGRIAALEGYFESLHGAFADMETVKKILGIEEKSENGRN